MRLTALGPILVRLVTASQRGTPTGESDTCHRGEPFTKEDITTVVGKYDKLCILRPEEHNLDQIRVRIDHNGFVSLEFSSCPMRQGVEDSEVYRCPESLLLHYEDRAYSIPRCMILDPSNLAIGPVRRFNIQRPRAKATDDSWWDGRFRSKSADELDAPIGSLTGSNRVSKSDGSLSNVRESKSDDNLLSIGGSSTEGSPVTDSDSETIDKEFMNASLESNTSMQFDDVDGGISLKGVFGKGRKKKLSKANPLLAGGQADTANKGIRNAKASLEKVGPFQSFLSSSSKLRKMMEKSRSRKSAIAPPVPEASPEYLRVDYNSEDACITVFARLEYLLRCHIMEYTVNLESSQIISLEHRPAVFLKHFCRSVLFKY